MTEKIRENVAALIGRDSEAFIFSKTGDSVPHYLYMAKLHLAGVIPLGDSCGLFDLSLLDPDNPWRGMTSAAPAESHADPEAESQSESLIKCRKCGSNTSFGQAQTRAGDEAMTVFIECLNPACKIKYRL